MAVFVYTFRCIGKNTCFTRVMYKWNYAPSHRQTKSSNGCEPVAQCGAEWQRYIRLGKRDASHRGVYVQSASLPSRLTLYCFLFLWFCFGAHRSLIYIFSSAVCMYSRSNTITSKYRFCNIYTKLCTLNSVHIYRAFWFVYNWFMFVWVQRIRTYTHTLRF